MTSTQKSLPILLLCLVSRPVLAVATQVDFHGFITTHVAVDSNASVDQTQVSRVTSQSDTAQTSFAFDASRFALSIRSMDDEKSEPPINGTFEFDLQNKWYFRPRQVFVAAGQDRVRVLAGLSDTLVGNVVGPHLFNNQWLWSQGNAYDRVPQLRLDGRCGHIYWGLAAVPSPSSEVQTVLPHLQVRLGIDRMNARFGVAAHIGSTSAAALQRAAASHGDVKPSSGLTSALASVDASVVLTPLVATVQVWWSQAGGHGTGPQAVDGPIFGVTQNGQVCASQAFGGFFDLAFQSERLVTGVTAGANQVPSSNRCIQGFSGMKSNQTVASYLRWRFAKSTEVVLEWQESITRMRLGSQTYHEKPCSMCTDVRYLTGMRYSF